MTCCEQPDVHQNEDHSRATCLSCGFPWLFDYQGKGRFKSKTKKWGPKWHCSDDYDRGWRARDYTKHEVVGTIRRGNREEYVVSCPKSLTTLRADADSPPDDVYCETCDRSGPLGPMVKRYQIRKEALD